MPWSNYNGHNNNNHHGPNTTPHVSYHYPNVNQSTIVVSRQPLLQLHQLKTSYPRVVSVPLFKLVGRLGNQDVIILIDCGASGNFINPTIVYQAQPSIKTVKCYQPVKLATDVVVNASSIAMSVPIRVGNYHDKFDLVMLAIEEADVILGLPWLQKYNPMVNWQQYQITFKQGQHHHQLTATTINKKKQQVVAAGMTTQVAEEVEEEEENTKENKNEYSLSSSGSGSSSKSSSIGSSGSDKASNANGVNHHGGSKKNDLPKQKGVSFAKENLNPKIIPAPEETRAKEETSMSTQEVNQKLLIPNVNVNQVKVNCLQQVKNASSEDNNSQLRLMSIRQMTRVLKKKSSQDQVYLLMIRK